MKSPIIGRRSVRELQRQLVEGRFAVPKLQRNFVWDAGRAAKLLDSIYRNIPIGSLFLWEMDKRSAKLIRQADGVLPPFSDANKQIWFVIDGQQRLSVIYQAIRGEHKVNDAGRSIYFNRLCYVLYPDTKQENAPRIVYRKPFGKHFVSICDILAPDWRHRMPNKAQAFLSRIRECRRRFLSYPVPIITVKAASLDEIGEVFIRVNSQGMRITSADRAIALMGDLDVRAMAEELRRKIRAKGFSMGAVDPILMGFNLVAESQRPEGDPPKLEAMARRWSKRISEDTAERDKFSKLWHRYQRGFELAVDYLRNRFPVHDESYLPSANMLATLSVFFFHQSKQPNQRQAAEIRKWFWATGVGQRYTGRGYHRNISEDAQLFQSLAAGKRRHFVFKELLDPVLDVQASEYAARSARTRAFFCLLAELQPRYLDNGEPIPLQSSVLSYSNKKHRHHVFPQAQLRQHFPPRTYNSLCNICFLVSHDNTRIGMRLPRKYLAEYREGNRDRFRKVMKSHLLPVGEESGVWERGIVRAFKKFRGQRLKMICDSFEDKAGIRLFKQD